MFDHSQAIYKDSATFYGLTRLSLSSSNKDNAKTILRSTILFVRGYHSVGVVTMLGLGVNHTKPLIKTTENSGLKLEWPLYNGHVMTC